MEAQAARDVLERSSAHLFGHGPGHLSGVVPWLSRQSGEVNSRRLLCPAATHLIMEMLNLHGAYRKMGHAIMDQVPADMRITISMDSGDGFAMSAISAIGDSQFEQRASTSVRRRERHGLDVHQGFETHIR